MTAEPGTSWFDNSSREMTGSIAVVGEVAKGRARRVGRKSMMFERELSGSFRQRGVHLLLATVLIIPSPAIAQLAGYPVDPAEQGRTRTRQTTGETDSTSNSTRSGDNAAATQIYVPRTYEPDELDGAPRIDATGRR